MNTNPSINELTKIELKYKRKIQELQRELDELKGKTQKTQETQDPCAVTIIRVSPFRYKHHTYLIDSTNVVHTYGDIYNGVDSKPIGKWDPINKILQKKHY